MNLLNGFAQVVQIFKSSMVFYRRVIHYSKDLDMNFDLTNYLAQLNSFWTNLHVRSPIYLSP